jgi:RES domain-containing protein
MKIYRMHRGARAAANYSGAMEAGGRWNPIGTPMLYTSQHLSLACVEILVHLDKSELPQDYVWSWTELEGTLDFLQFRDLDHVSSCQAAGRSWIDAATHLAIQVPSVVIPEEFNILLNPAHSGYAALVWSEPRAFRFDPRLSGSQPSPCRAGRQQ